MKVERINSFISNLKSLYHQQGQAGRILIPFVFLLMFCCLCSLAFSVLSARSRSAPDITPSPVIPTSAGTQPTPTALFGLGSTPFPTPVAPSPLPTTLAPATATAIPTQTIPPATATQIATETQILIPTSTNTVSPPTAADSSSVEIIGVNKRAEYVEIRNTGGQSVDLTDWKLVSEMGNQPCTLRVILLPNEVLRVWSRKGDGGLSCGYHINIWNDNQADPAVLYDAQGREVSRFP
jgi:hypothetical protein